MGVLETAFWVLFPHRCICCDKIIARNSKICKDCAQKIERTGALCTLCGCDKKNCQCRYRIYRFRGIVAPFKYGEFSRRAIINFKVHGNIVHADFFAENMAAKVKEYFPEVKFDYVVCLPMHFYKILVKGFNHSEALARRVAKLLNVPFTDCLVKSRMGKPQHKMSFKNRYSNVLNAFYAKPMRAENVLLVDDIKTTGAGLNECARQLMFAGCKNVYCVTAVSTFKEEKK